jgi:hypothetical protein
MSGSASFQRAKKSWSATGFGGVALNRLSTSKAKVREGSERRVGNYCAVVDKLLKFSGGLLALVERQVRLAPNVRRIKGASLVVLRQRKGKIIRTRLLQKCEGLCRMASPKLNVGAYDRQPVVIERRVQWKVFLQLISQ